jgi:hypothetical protein
MAIVQRDKQGHRRAGRRKRSAGAEKESVAFARLQAGGRPAVSFYSPRGGAALDEIVGETMARAQSRIRTAEGLRWSRQTATS